MIGATAPGPYVCPTCGALLVLRELGSYGGRRAIDATGVILPDSYHEEWSECEHIVLACGTEGCAYENWNMVVEKERVRAYVNGEWT